MIQYGGGAAHGHAHSYYDADIKQECLLLVFTCEHSGLRRQVPHRFLKSGEGIYREQSNTQVVVFTDTADEAALAWKKAAVEIPMIHRKDFSTFMSLLWLHPNQPEKYVHLGYDRDSKPKVVFQRVGDAGTNPHGAWNLHPFVSDRCGAPYSYPSAVDPKSPVLAVRFNCRGVEVHSSETLLGRVRVTLNVFVAIGTVVDGVGIRIYQDEEIAAMRDFHIHAVVLGDDCPSGCI